MSIPPYKNGTLLIPTGPSKHLHVICNNPVFYARKGTESVLLVNICSLRDDAIHDPTCILLAGDHAFIKHDSYVAYSRAGLFIASNVTRCLAAGIYNVHDDLADSVFDRVIEGFWVSRNVNLVVRRFVEALYRNP